MRDVVSIMQVGETELQGEMHFDDASRRTGRSPANFIPVSPLDSLNAECKGRHYVSPGRNVLSQSETQSARKNRGDSRAGATDKERERVKKQRWLVSSAKPSLFASPSAALSLDR